MSPGAPLRLHRVVAAGRAPGTPWARAPVGPTARTIAQGAFAHPPAFGISACVQDSINAWRRRGRAEDATAHGAALEVLEVRAHEYTTESFLFRLVKAKGLVCLRVKLFNFEIL